MIATMANVTTSLIISLDPKAFLLYLNQALRTSERVKTISKKDRNILAFINHP